MKKPLNETLTSLDRRSVIRDCNRRIRKIKRTSKIRCAVAKFRKYLPLYVLLALVFGLCAWYCISLGEAILGGCLVVFLLAFLTMSALDLI